VAVNWIGLLAPANTPQPVIDKLHAAVLRISERPELKSTLANAAVQVSVSKTPGEFKAFLDAEYEKWGNVVKTAGVKTND